jgi:glyoxylase-like metal-dependent hydrolase (beta-lactamase superfamily II)
MRAMGVDDGWVEIGDRFFVRRYTFYDQNIGVVLGGAEALVIDTRSTYVQAREVLDDLRELTHDPVTVVVDTHGHFDHAFGNHIFRPATVWGQAGCVPFMHRTGMARKTEIGREAPEIAADLPEVAIDPPDRTFDDAAMIEVGDAPSRSTTWAAATPTTTRSSPSRARTSCGPATCWRAATSRSSATATRSTGRPRPPD